MPKTFIKVNHFCILIFAIALISLLSSCANNKRLVYINDLSDTSKVMLPSIKFNPSVIQADDILEIRIGGENPQTVADFNSKGDSYGGATSGVNYLVDENGDIGIYRIGKIRAAGLTKEQLRDKLLNMLNAELKNATVIIRFVNFRYTILGEVKSGGNYSSNNEKVSILEAIASAGDMTVNAKRSAVRVIRDSSGVREAGIINFNQKTLFTSPYFYLRRNDVIIVETDLKAKKSADAFAKTSTYLGLLSGIIALVITIISITK